MRNDCAFSFVIVIGPGLVDLVGVAEDGAGAGVVDQELPKLIQISCNSHFLKNK